MALFSDLAMSLRSVFAADGERDITDERFWSTDGFVGVSASGMPITLNNALRVSCIFQGTRLYAETLGSLPLIIYREPKEGEKERARDHYLWALLRGSPNPYQTAQQFRESMTAWALLEGTAYAEIVYGSGDSPIQEIVPIEPALVTPEKLASGRVRYRIQGRDEPLVEEQMFKLAGMGLEPLIGLNLLNLARETIGLWLAQEKFQATYFTRGATPGIWLKHPKKLSKEVHDRLKETAAQRYTGPRNWHAVQIAEEGMDVVSIGASAKDAQMSEAREQAVLDCARWLNLPEHMLRAGKQVTYASAEQFGREMVDYSFRPWAVRWDQSIGKYLIFEKDVYAEILMDALLRGNTIERAEANAILVTNGIKTRNEVRREENLPPIDGLDEPLTPLNMERTGAVPSRRQQQKPAKPAPPQKAPPAEESAFAETLIEARLPRRLSLIVQNAAARVVRKEIAAVRDRALKVADNQAAWAKWLTGFYDQHAGLVAQTLELEPSIARAYADRHRDALITQGLTAVDSWEPAAVAELANLALELEEEPAHV